VKNLKTFSVCTQILRIAQNDKLKLKNMKSVMITFDQAFYERILKTLDRLNCRGFSYFQDVQGRGSKTGEPHYGSHAWPSMCSAIITVVDDQRVDPLLEALQAMDKETEMLGLRAFVWNVEKSI
jgi:nitrogen regulatory protein PII